MSPGSPRGALSVHHLPQEVLSDRSGEDLVGHFDLTNGLAFQVDDIELHG
jgi:hypothetical protein